MEQHKIIVVTGATGQVGSAVVKHLLERGFTVRAFVRDPGSSKAVALQEAGALLAVGDMDDPASLDNACKGAYGVVSIQPQRISESIATPGSPAGLTDADQVRYGRHVADAAKANDIQHFIYCSVGGVDTPGIRVFDMKRSGEAYIRELGLPATMLRPYNFMENYFGGWGDWAREGNGTVPSPIAATVKEHLIAVADIAAFTAIVLEQPHNYIGQHIDLAGDVQTVPETAACISRVTGREVTYMHIPAQVMEEMDPRMAEAVAWLNSSPVKVDIPALRKIHPGLLSFEAWLRGKC